MQKHFRNFRLKVLSLMLQDSWMMKIGNYVIKQDYFEAQDELDICSAILDYREKYGHSPSDPDDLIVMTDTSYQEVIYDLYEFEEETEFAKDAVIQWAKEQEIKQAILDSIPKIESGELSYVVDRITKAVAIGDIPLTSSALDLTNIDQWLTTELFTEKIPTGLYHVDLHLEGGLSRGEQAWILAPSNRGKSTTLVNIAYGAASAGVGKNVVIFSHEMSPTLYAKRFAARLMFRFPKRRENLDDYKHHMKYRMEMLLRGRIKILGGRRMKQSEIEHDLDILRNEGFVPDVIIDDYPDLILPDTKSSQLRFELAEIARWFRDLGSSSMYNAVVWGAVQSTRAAFNKRVITEQDVAEDIEKIRIADVVLTLCQTKTEFEQNLCRLYAAKVRDGRRGFMIDCLYNTDSQALITIGDSKIVLEEDDND